MDIAMIGEDLVVNLVICSLRDVLEQTDMPVPAEIDGATTLVGPDAVLDSLGVVSLIVDVEQRLEVEHNVMLTLANDRAMSQRSSPFRTVQTFAEYICTMMKEENGRG